MPAACALVAEHAAARGATRKPSVEGVLQVTTAGRSGARRERRVRAARERASAGSGGAPPRVVWVRACARVCACVCARFPSSSDPRGGDAKTPLPPRANEGAPPLQVEVGIGIVRALVSPSHRVTRLVALDRAPHRLSPSARAYRSSRSAARPRPRRARCFRGTRCLARRSRRRARATSCT